MVALLGLVAMSPFLAIVALMVKSDGGPAFFRQVRTGKDGIPFRIYKFRTMRHLPADQASPGLQITAGRDPRITPLGRVLRKCKIDEFAQLLNVLAGDMSLVGPRPEVPRYTALWPEDVKLAVLSVRPGLTDFASLQYYDEQELLAGGGDIKCIYIKQVLPQKLRLNLLYVKQCNFRLDMALLICTIVRMIGKKTSCILGVEFPKPLATWDTGNVD